MPVIRKLLSPSQLYNPHLSYDETNDLVLYDGVPSPQFDPRSQNPPIPDTFEDKRCASAATVVALMRAAVEQIIANIAAGRDATFIVSAFLALMAVLGWIAIFVALIAALVGAALAAGVEALETAFTNETWDTLTCIIYCHTNTDGWIDTDSIPLIKADVDAQLPTLAAVIINYYLDAFGTGGLASAYIVLQGLVEGDCAECACEWCWTWDEADIYEVGGGWAITNFLTTHAGTTATTDFVFDAVSIHFTYSLSGFGAFIDGNSQIWLDGSLEAEEASTEPTGELEFVAPEPLFTEEVMVSVSSRYADGSNYPVITSITIVGRGTLPAFATGHEC